MKYTHIRGQRLSAFSLGTVQLGLNYGINNAVGKPDRAVELGVNSLDTAAGYGDSEEVIGAWLKARPGMAKPFIATKIKGLDHSSLKALRADVREKVRLSKSRLGLEKLPLLMLHDFDDYGGDRENVRIVFDELKADGEIGLSGISAYSYHDYGVLAESGFDAVQIPQNIFDWGQIDSGGLKKIADAGMIIFIRSVFLQGIIFKRPADLDPRMGFCRPALERFHAFCEEFGLSPAALAMSFALSLPGIASLVLGCEAISQVEDNAALIEETITLSPERMERLHEAFRDTDPRMLNPASWFNAGR